MRRFCVAIVLLILVLTACGKQQGIEVVSGELLSLEEQQSLYEQRFEQVSEPDLDSTAKVYWSSTGSKYHKNPKCSYLKNAKDVQSGTLAQAANHGAGSPCTRCAGG